MSLHEVWESASGSPFYPTIPKNSQFTVGFGLLLIGKYRHPGQLKPLLICSRSRLEWTFWPEYAPLKTHCTAWSDHS